MYHNVSNFTPFLIGLATPAALGFLMICLLKEKGLRSEKTYGFAKLPVEIKVEICKQCDSLNDVASLIAASPSVRACFQENRDNLLLHHISYIREIFYDDTLIPLALMVVTMRRRLTKNSNMDNLVELLGQFVHGKRYEVFERKFHHWQECLLQIQDLVNICTEIQEICPRVCYSASAAYVKPLLSKPWHHRFVETYLRSKISAAMRDSSTTSLFPYKHTLSHELDVFLFADNYAGSKLPDRYTADIVDAHVALCQLGATTLQRRVSVAGDPVERQGMLKERKAEIQNWRDMRKMAWHEEDKKVENGQMAVYSGFGRLL